MSNENNLSNIGGSAPTTKLMEICENVVCVLYEPTRIKRRAKAETDRIKAVSNIEISESEQRGVEA
jgi:hypothetical protein